MGGNARPNMADLILSIMENEYVKIPRFGSICCRYVDDPLIFNADQFQILHNWSTGDFAKC